MSLNEFRGSQEFEEVQKLNQAIRDGIESKEYQMVWQLKVV